MIPSQATLNLLWKFVCVSSILACVHYPLLFADERSASSQLAITQLLDDLETANATIGRLVDSIEGTNNLHDDALPLVAAAWNRILIEQSSDEQYEILLSWTMPNEDRADVRLWSTPVPTLAPPKSFARAIGKRPRDTTFSVAETGGVPGWFSNGALLIAAADDLGRLPRLISALEPLNEAGVVGAKPLLAMALAANDRGGLQLCEQLLSDDSIDPHLISLALVASQVESLTVQSIETLQRFANQDTPLRSSMQYLHALAVQRHLGQSAMRSLLDPQLTYWAAGGGIPGTSSEQFNPPPIWLTYENHVLHLSGSGLDTLYCKFPMNGDFEMIGETQTGGPDDLKGGLIYGGLRFELDPAKDQLHVTTLDDESIETLRCPFALREAAPVFTRLSVRGFEGKTHVEVNLHPMWPLDKNSLASSPWLAMQSKGGTRQAFRNWRISGEPNIPKEVDLLAGDRLIGWRRGFETSKNKQTNGEWKLNAGVLSNSEVFGSDSQDMLVWDRPLLSGEKIQYEFFAASEIAPALHPAFGRMAFLLLPDGIQVRWLTGNTIDWTGLTEDHSVLEPLSRRGPKPLPLKYQTWNQVRMSHLGDSIQLFLNGELIYNRKLDFEGPPQFSFYCDNRSQPVQVRNIKVSGDWPEKLPEEFQKSPTVSIQNSPNAVKPGVR